MSEFRPTRRGFLGGIAALLAVPKVLLGAGGPSEYFPAGYRNVTAITHPPLDMKFARCAPPRRYSAGRF